MINPIITNNKIQYHYYAGTDNICPEQSYFKTIKIGLFEIDYDTVKARTYFDPIPRIEDLKEVSVHITFPSSEKYKKLQEQFIKDINDLGLNEIIIEKKWQYKGKDFSKINKIRMVSKRLNKSQYAVYFPKISVEQFSDLIETIIQRRNEYFDSM
jgi:hypothetical protein